MNKADKKSGFLYDIAAYLVYALMIFIFLRFSWMRWGDLIIDTGKEWYVPSELLSGRLLYRDIAWLYGPLVPYLNALFFKIGGIQISGLVASGIFSLALTVYALHKLAGVVLDKLSAFIVVATFILICAFGFYVTLANYNYIVPYSYASTYGMAFALLGLHFFHEKIPVLTILFLSLALLTRIEIGIVALLAIGLSSTAAIVADKKKTAQSIQNLLRMGAISIGIAILGYVFFFGLLIHEDTGFWKAFLAHLSPGGRFAQRLAGLEDPSGHLKVMFDSFGRYILLGILFALGGWAAGLAHKAVSPVKALVIYLLSACVCLVITFHYFFQWFRVEEQFRCLPLLCLLVAVNAVRNLWKGIETDREWKILTVSLFSLLVLLRVILRVWAGHYGFYLLVPGLIVYYAFFLQVLPSLFQGQSIRWFLRGGFAFLSAFFILSNLRTEASHYDQRNTPVVTPRGTLFFPSFEKTLQCGNLIEYLKQNAKPDETLAVFPEGVGLNFLSGLRNPLNDYVCNPIDLAPAGVSARAIEQLEKFKVTYVAVLQRDTAEYGFSAFGKDYGADIMAYVIKNYEINRQFGPVPYTNQGFGITLYKRKTVKDPQ